MSYDPAQLSTNPIYRMRLRLQDNDDDEYLVDDEYTFLLAENNNSEGLATVAAATSILARLAQFERSREGQIEVYADSFGRYKMFLEEFLRTSATNNLSVVLVGGVRRSEVDRVQSDDESMGPGYTQDYLFNQIQYTYGGGSQAAGTEFNNRDGDNSFRLRRP